MVVPPLFPLSWSCHWYPQWPVLNCHAAVAMWRLAIVASWCFGDLLRGPCGRWPLALGLRSSAFGCWLSDIGVGIGSAVPIPIPMCFSHAMIAAMVTTMRGLHLLPPMPSSTLATCCCKEGIAIEVAIAIKANAHLVAVAVAILGKQAKFRPL